MMIYLIIIINILVFLGTNYGKLHTQDLSASYYSVFVQKDYKRLITSGFAHFSWMHLILNMLSLYNVGFVIERLYGSLFFVIIYFVILVVGQTMSLIMKHNHQKDYSGSLGASGAICGLIGIIAIKVYISVGLSGLRNLSSTIISLIVISLVPGIDGFGHLFGFATGVLIGFLL